MNRRDERGYAFDNTSRHAQAHHQALSRLLDETTKMNILNLMGDVHGAHCLDVGAGAGHMALWLAAQGGSSGQVTAVDIAPVNIPERDNLRVIRQDVAADGVPEGPYDLITARLLLNHLPARRVVLTTLVQALKPGGVLLVEDFDPPPPERMVAVAPDDDAAKLMVKFLAANREVIARHGGDSTWSSRVLAAMVEEGLTDVETVVHGASWPGGSPGCELLTAGLAQIRHELLILGMTMEELFAVRDLLADPRLILHGFRLCSTSGHRAD